MCLTITGCQKDSEEIIEIKECLNREIPANLILVNDEEYEITQIKQVNVNKTPIGKEEYTDYKINDKTLCFEFEIKTANGKTEKFYDIFHTEHPIYNDHFVTYNTLRHSIVTKKGESINIGKFHHHSWQFNIHQPELFYFCGSCNTVKRVYDIETESLTTPLALTEEERQDRLVSEEEAKMDSIKKAFTRGVKIKDAISYEIIDIAKFDNDYYNVTVKTSGGVTGIIQVARDYGNGGLRLKYKAGTTNSFPLVYDLSTRNVTWDN